MARPKFKAWLYLIMLKSIFAQDKPVGWRLESVEPNIIRHGDWINLYVSFLVFYGCLRFCRKIVRLVDLLCRLTWSALYNSVIV